MEPGVRLDDMMLQIEVFKNSDNERQKLFDMYQQLKEMELKNQDLRLKIEKLEYSETNYLRDLRELRSGIVGLFSRLYETSSVDVAAGLVAFHHGINRWRQSSGRASVVGSLFAADCLQFLDRYVKEGVDGGRQAISDLKAKLLEHFGKLDGYQSHWEVVIRLYVRLDGLAKTYVDGRIVDSVETVRKFYRGFNEVYRTCEAIDAGNDKDASDDKVKQNITLFVNNQHCKHIVLAGSADKGYVGFLRSIIGDRRSRAQMSLIESVPFPRDFKTISTNFAVLKLDDIFRNSAEIEAEPSRSVVPNAPGNSYAARAAIPNSLLLRGSQSQGSPARPDILGEESPLRPKIQRNRDGQRIDDRLAPWDPELVRQLTLLKLCHRYYLTKCNFVKCPHDHHHRPLTGEEKAALRRVARSGVCGRRTRCDDPYCVAAHNCIYDDQCTYGDECKYPHIEDRVIVTAF